MAIRRTWAIAFLRPSTPSRSSWWKASVAAATASSTDEKTPLAPSWDPVAGRAEAAGGFGAAGAPVVVSSAMTWRTMAAMSGAVVVLMVSSG
jgi:hypothetical protein